MIMVATDDKNYVREHVRQVPDFPKPGILFLDVTTALKAATGNNSMTTSSTKA